MRWLFLGAATLLAALTGCSRPSSSVHGSVLYRGKPLGGGSIVLVAPDNRTYPARIQSDGSYRIAAVPRGRILVAVQAEIPRTRPRANPDVKADAAAAKAKDAFARERANADDAAKRATLTPKAAAPAGAQLPASYGDPNRSGLSFELHEPDQEYNVDIR